MLGKARDRGSSGKLGNVAGLYEMDAGALAFPDESFDTVVAMYVMTVVPDAERVMRELERVCAPGGEVILVNHFSQEEGVRGFVERRLAPLATSIGWHAGVQARPRPRVRRSTARGAPALWPFGLFTMLRFVKEPGFGLVPQRVPRQRPWRGGKAGQSRSGRGCRSRCTEALA